MSVRAVGSGFFKHGTALVRLVFKREAHTSIYPRKINNTRQGQGKIVPRNDFLRNVGVQISRHARKIINENASRVSNPRASNLHKGLLYGLNAPLLGLVGVTVASGSGLLTKEDELEGVCWEIRECMSKIKWYCREDDVDDVIDLKSFTFGKAIAKGSSAVVYSAKLKNSQSEDYNFAIKMMFNYDIQSNATAILRGMYKECVPARMHRVPNFDSQLLRYLPPHPNIVNIITAFADYVPELDECRELYPAALPQRIDPNGEGRNMSLFLLMKKYDKNLRDYLSETVLPAHESVLLFTQLLEGVAHMVSNSVAHRDLKADNILLDLTNDSSPTLVITDFGCCLAEGNSSLTLSYVSFDVDRGGNAALMAPEIINQKPGTFGALNYSKSDLWACGALGYEIFGAPNPFYARSGLKLRNVDYKEEKLPSLPDKVPKIIKKLIGNLLRVNPNQRLEADIAANVCQLYLWAPKSWLSRAAKTPSSREILEWLLNLTAKVLCETRISKQAICSEYLLISSFLCRAKLSRIKSALVWMQRNA